VDLVKRHLCFVLESIASVVEPIALYRLRRLYRRQVGGVALSHSLPGGFSRSRALLVGEKDTND